MPLTHITEREIIEDLQELKIGQKGLQRTLDRIDERLEKSDEKMNNASEIANEAKHKAGRALFQVGILWGAVIAVITAIVIAVATGIMKFK